MTAPVINVSCTKTLPELFQGFKHTVTLLDTTFDVPVPAGCRHRDIYEAKVVIKPDDDSRAQKCLVHVHIFQSNHDNYGVDGSASYLKWKLDEDDLIYYQKLSELPNLQKHIINGIDGKQISIKMNNIKPMDILRIPNKGFIKRDSNNNNNATRGDLIIQFI